MVTIKKALLSDLPVVLSIIQHGREKMMASGNLHQWGSTHPADEQIRNDIEKGNSYLVISDEKTPIATFAFIKGIDPTYLKIDGEGWLNNEPYGTIHRIASVPNARGVLSAVVEYCFQKVKNIRIDTHEDNIIMRNALKKLGFTYCGIIHLENGDPRLAFQKTLTTI
ncbi:GNAT family N-acetyltransferase [Prevotella falsenii]|uniref:GNAT family N-acetyltransferase n=1 Tax=Prevotella falsenii TaxID=515414 RepID=UPI0004691C32|nr:GNAT family N-acetyltransferase [Prevotella falsenii]